MKRKRGRPRKFQGDKDHVDFDGALERTAPVVMTFLLGRALAAREPAKRGLNRYEAALLDAAEQHGFSARTVERLRGMIGRMMESLVEELVQHPERPVRMFVETPGDVHVLEFRRTGTTITCARVGL